MKKSARPIRLSTLTVAAVTTATLLAVSFCIAIFASVYSRSFVLNAKVNVRQATGQAAVSVNNTLNSMRARLNGIKAVLQKSATLKDFESQVQTIGGFEDEILAVFIYTESGKILSCSGSRYALKSAAVQDLSFQRELFEKRPDFAVSGPHVQTVFAGVYPWAVTVAAKLSQPAFENGRYLAVDFNFNYLADYIDKVGIGQHGYCYITDMENNLIYHPQQQVLYAGLKSEDAKAVAGKGDGVYQNGEEITAVSTTPDGLWRIVGKSYTTEFASEKQSQIIAGVAFSLFCCAAVALAVLLVWQKIVTKPVRALILAMQSFERQANSFCYTPGTQSVAELQVLCNTFAHLTGRIKQLMEQVRLEQTELRKTELKALQAQINPHFLYNTLDSIQWMCEQGKTADAAKMVSALARLFRISISKGQELIPLEKELQHAKSYLVIQSYRYRNQFSYRFKVEEGLSHYLCNKITVQPLIENAIYHGLDRMVDEGEIVITVCSAPENNTDILIKVQDNGVGMTPEQCQKILQKGRSDSGGIGVKNVNDRLKIYFGSAYGLTVESELDVGTTVTVRIPKITKEVQP